MNAVSLVILGEQAECVGLDAQVDVLADEDGGVLRLRLLNGQGEGEDAVVHGVAVEQCGTVVLPVFLENDFQLAAVGQLHAFAQAAFAAKAVEHPRNGARILAEFGGFAFEAVNFLDDFDGQQNGVFFKVQEGIGIVQEDVGVEDVVFHLSKSRKQKLENRNRTDGNAPPG